MFDRRLDRWRIAPAMLLVPAGAIVGFSTHDALAASLDTDTLRPIIEVVLAVLLFWHAIHIRGGFFGGQGGTALRLLLIGVPLSVVLSLLIGLGLLPDLQWPAVLAIACVVVPVDFAPVVAFLHDERIPERVRNLLNVEEGYTDGILSPVLLFALAVAVGDHSASESVVHAVRDGIPHLGIAIVVGVALGSGIALCANAADRRGWTSERSNRLILLCAPVLAYTLNVGLHGNGFLAAFICGIAFNGVRHYRDADRDSELIDDVAFVLSGVVWFLVGAVAWYVFRDGVTLRVLLLTVLVVTVVRLVAIPLALLGSPLSRPERRLLAVLGPRGTANIVLGLFAFNVLHGPAEDAVLEATLLAVLGSVVIHGLLGPVLVARYAKAAAARTA